LSEHRLKPVPHWGDGSWEDLDDVDFVGGGGRRTRGEERKQKIENRK
jgi:hypothetical protein